MTAPRSTLRVAFIAAWGLLASGSLCQGFGGALVRMPPQAVNANAAGPTFTARTGLALEVDTRWFDAGGYRPVQLRVSSATARSVDRVVEVEVSLAGPSGRGLAGEPGLVMTGQVVLPAGATAADATLLCPGVNEWRFAWWQARVDGETAPRLSVPRGGAIPIGVNPQPVTLRKLNPRIEGIAPPFRAREGSVTRFRRISISGPTIDDAVAPFQTEWLAYTGTDIVAMDLDELETLATSSPEELTALRRWILAGGTLWIERSGATDARFATIDQVLRVGTWRFQATESEQGEETSDQDAMSVVPPQSRAAPQSAIEPEESYRNESKEKPRQGRLRRVNEIEGHPGWGHALLGKDETNTEALAKQRQAGDPGEVVRQLLAKTKDTQGWYAQRDVGFGQVLAFRRTALETPLALALGGAREAANLWSQRGWGNRHGFEPTEPSSAFGNLLIPGVGIAPVNEFQVLITLFVLAIGPLNYWLLWRRQQLQLLVLTTPLCALAVTLGLFAYAAVADGFDVKARVRSVTLLDQTTGEAATWSRVSHYVAMMPEKLPCFPNDTAVYPIRPVWESAIAAAPPASRRIDWRDGRQTLASGWIPSRTTVQHLTVRCRETEARLLVREEPDGVEISNQLGAPIELLLVRGSEGEWARVTKVDAGAVTPLDVVPRAEALTDLRLMALANQPEFPLGAGRAVEQTLERLGSGRDIRRMQRNLSTASLTDNLLNQQLGNLSGLSGGRGLDVPPRTYVAVTAQAVETPLGWDEVQEIGSFHVIVGRW